MAPADVRKAGPIFDLPIAIGLLVATGQISGEHLEGAILVGELSLDGSVRPIAGALPTAIGARERGQTRLYVPAANAREAAIVAGVDVFPVATLAEMVRALALPSTLAPLPCDLTMLDTATPHYQADFMDVNDSVPGMLCYTVVGRAVVRPIHQLQEAHPYGAGQSADNRAGRQSV